ncbi:MAG: hypothetical protein ACJ8H8_14810, partial [Geminicoccaceae bacterium]
PWRCPARTARGRRDLTLRPGPADPGDDRPDRRRVRRREADGHGAPAAEALFGLRGLEPVSHAVVWSLGRLIRLLIDFLDLAKIESGRMEWHLEDCTSAEIVAPPAGCSASAASA